jgi:hypothetical protein
MLGAIASTVLLHRHKPAAVARNERLAAADSSRATDYSPWRSHFSHSRKSALDLGFGGGKPHPAEQRMFLSPGPSSGALFVVAMLLSW